MSAGVRTVAILQARCSSSRLPGKVLKPILGTPMLAHQLARLGAVTQIDKLVVATSTEMDFVRHAMLTGASLSDNAPFAHSMREQNLTERVVNLVRAGMEQIFAFQINFGAGELAR